MDEVAAAKDEGLGGPWGALRGPGPKGPKYPSIGYLVFPY